MKTIFIGIGVAILTLIGLLDAHAIPGEKISIDKLSGVVETGAWRDDFTLNRMELRSRTDSGHVGTYTIKKHWVLILRDVEGAPFEIINEMSLVFLRSEPADSIYFQYKKDTGRMLIWLTGDKELGIKIGSKVTISNVQFHSDEWGGGFSYDSLKVE